MNKIVFLLFIIVMYSCSTKKEKNDEATTTMNDIKESTSEKQLFKIDSAVKAMESRVPHSRFPVLFSDEPQVFETSIDPDEKWWSADDMDMYTPAKRPKWNDVLNGYPRKKHDGSNESEELYRSVGGVVASIYNANPGGCANTCALRMSVALNEAGVPIPSKTDHTFKGKNGKFYFLSAAKFFHWMLESFGKPEFYFADPAGFNWSGQLDEMIFGKKGIYIIQARNRIIFGASGHADLLNEMECIGGNCYFNLSGGAIRVGVWTLKE